MKLPAFQFYPADWRKDPGVQSLSFNDRGIWFEILCLMHESSDRGKLTLRGQPMPEDALARLLGLDKQNLTKALTTLLEYGVASRCPDSGALVCRRMIRDEEIRRKRTEAGKLGGNPTLLGKRPPKVVKQTVNQNPTPSSSISTSSSETPPLPPKPEARESVGNLDALKKRINGLKQEWGKPARWSYAEDQTLFGGAAAQMEEMDDDDWKLVADYLSARMPQGSAYWQPRNRDKFCETFSNTWAEARRWADNTGRKPKQQNGGIWR